MGAGLATRQRRRPLAPRALPSTAFAPGGAIRARTRGVLAALAACAAALAANLASSLPERIDEPVFDFQVRIARTLRGGGAPPDIPGIVLVGVDDPSLQSLGVPMGMLHAGLGSALEAIARAQPRAIGLDIALPEQSLERVAPGLDRELLRGVRSAREAAPLVIALDVDAEGRLRVPALPLLAAAGGPDAFGLALFPVDCDGVIRRYEPDAARAAVGRALRCGALAAPASPASPASPTASDLRAGEPGSGGPGSGDSGFGEPIAVPTFAARLAQALGRGDALRDAAWIDFTRGAQFSYVPLREVLDPTARRDADSLRTQFGGRVVLVGSVLPYVDRLPLPAALAAWESPATPPPGLVVNAQVLRAALGGGLIHPLPAPFAIALVAALAALALLDRPSLRWTGFGAAVLILVFGGVPVQMAGWFAAPGAALLVGAVAMIARGSADLVAARGDRAHLARSFASYVSPQLFSAILERRVQAAGRRADLALLFADLRGFTARSEHADPAAMHAMLNRYYETVTPVLHRQGGTIDNFRGDGIMVMFGALAPDADPCVSAYRAARELLAAVDGLNTAHFVPQGLAPIEVAIGLAYGEVLLGDVGGPERRDFTALGDAVNVAARLQDLAKDLEVPALMTDAFAARLPEGTEGIESLGARELKGHTPVVVWRFR